jgi:cobalt-precorrin 5A hydrolase
MKAAAIAFSEYGAALARRIGARLYLHGRDFYSVHEITARLWSRVDALVFICACGIAVRAIAPHIESKLKDPAVAVCDETGHFAISLLSGHAGGANALTEQIAAQTGAMPVVTTASDCHDANRARNLVLGIGCRRGLSAETIERAVTVMLWREKIPLSRVVEAATIDLKRDEEGLLGFAEAHGIPLRFYSAEELRSVPGEFASSERVLKATGVGNVCERASALCGGKGRLVMRKTARDGVTVSAFERE